jgi:hypothetical protein
MRKTFLLLALLTAVTSQASNYDVNVVVDGSTRREYAAGGTTYIEALRGRNYTLRVTNPTPHRVAVALSVDGLNTIDARHTDGWNATKWVIEPYGSIDIDGWQVSDSTARRFVFTGERRSYGAALGQTENLGVIEAIFFRERELRLYEMPQRDEERSAGAAPRSSASKAQPDDDYAATGMGGRTRNEVTTVDIDLDPHPVASVRIRYEFRPQLVKLGVLPRDPSPLERREKARGFDRYCPEPD